MNKKIAYSIGLLPVLGAASLPAAGQGAMQEQKPNVLLIFIDDMGWPAVSCLGNDIVNTKNIDRIAEEGMLFTDAYVNPQCSPSRASLLTGQHTARNRFWHVVGRYGYPYMRLEEPPYQENLPRESYTMAEMLQDNGYYTAINGKWHLNTWNDRYPDSDGFYTYLFAKANKYFGWDYNTQPEDMHYPSKTDKGVDYLTDEAIKAIESRGDKPFFVYLAQHTIHSKVLAPEKLVKKYLKKGYPEEGVNNATYLAAIEHLDDAVGRLLKYLDKQKLTENTMVIFLSDNGGVDMSFSNAPLRYGKGSMYEGGIRVPMIVRWPGKVKAGSVCHTPVHCIDIYPTLLEMAGGKMEQEWTLDGESLLPLLTDGKAPDRDALYWFMPLYDASWGATPSAVMRKGDYKLIEFFGDYCDREDNWKYIPKGRTELYNLAEDLGETHDLAAEMPDKTAAMRADLYRWIDEMDAPLPIINERFDPDRAWERTPYPINFRPILEDHFDNLEFAAGAPFSFVLDTANFREYDDEALSYELCLEGGERLPFWINWDRKTNILSGTAEKPVVLKVEVKATDPQGASAKDRFLVTFK